MTPEQLAALLENLRAGIPLVRSVKAASGMSPKRWAAWLVTQSGNVRREVDEATEAGRANERAAEQSSMRADEGTKEHANDERGSDAAREEAGGRAAAPELAANDDGRALPQGSGRPATPEASSGSGESLPAGSLLAATGRQVDAVLPRNVEEPRSRVGDAPPRVATTWADLARLNPPAPAAKPRAIVTPRKVVADEQGKIVVNHAAIRVEAADEYGPGLHGLLLWQDARLVAAGWPAMSPWWKWSTAEFLLARVRWFVILAGRGMGKSTTLTRLAALFATWCPRVIPPAQRWICPFISVRPTDADRRIEEIGGIHHAAYGMDLKSSSPRGVLTMELDDATGQPIAYNSLASTIGNVKGPSVFAVLFDEEAAMRKEGANPSGEILASLVATFRARDDIYGIRCSSAWERSGSHWNAVKNGDTLTNHVARIGADFIDIARAGFVEVALWEEQAKGDGEAARQLRAYAAALMADSYQVPTWVGNPTIPSVKSRIDMDALDDETLELLYPGLDRRGAWMREFGSSPPGDSTFEDDVLAYEVMGEPSRYANATARERGY